MSSNITYWSTTCSNSLRTGPPGPIPTDITAQRLEIFLTRSNVLAFSLTVSQSASTVSTSLPGTIAKYLAMLLPFQNYSHLFWRAAKCTPRLPLFGVRMADPASTYPTVAITKATTISTTRKISARNFASSVPFKRFNNTFISD
jgi:hypothetical protein